MPYTSEGGSSYWIDDTIPTTPNSQILSNRYLTTEGNVIFHPRWRYDKDAELYVTDEYLFYNNGYLRVIETEPPNVGLSSTTCSYATQNPPGSWTGIGSTAVEVTWDSREDIPLPIPPNIFADEDYVTILDSDGLYPVSISYTGISTDEFETRAGILTENLTEVKDSLISLGYTGSAVTSFDPTSVGLSSVAHSRFFALIGANEAHYDAIATTGYGGTSVLIQGLRARYEESVQLIQEVDDLI